MKIKPLSDRVLLKPLENETQTLSWIYIPDSVNKERPYIYEVVEVGPWKEDKPITLKVWDKVLSGQYSWDNVKLNNTEYKIVWMDYILAVVED